MEKQDLRTLTEAERTVLRKRGIRMIKQGIKKGDAAQLLGVNKNTVSNWWKSYTARGTAGLTEQKRGAPSEAKKLLSAAQEKAIQKMLIDTMPDQLKLDYALWTRKAVRELVKREFDVSLAINTMGDYLRTWGFTPQKPKKRAYEQRPAEVQHWLEHAYPAIKKQARAEQAEIHWADETGVRNSCQHGRSYAPKGRTPVKKSMAKRFSVHMISTVTNQGKVHFMIYSDAMNSERFIEFLQQLIKTSSRKLYVIADNLRVHHSRAVTEWVQAHEGQIALFFLPAYSPEKNPDEYLNCDVKQGMSQTPAPKDPSTLTDNLRSYMNMLAKMPQRVKKYFNHPDIQYAAAEL
jgi:transposase